MKKILLPFGLMIAFIILSTGTLSAQSDKEIIKAANLDIKDKDYELAFEKIVTVSKPENKKVQEILKNTYPNIIADYLAKATAIKLSDKDSTKVKCEKLEQIIGYLNDGMITDSLFKKLAQPDLYKSLSKKKKLESTMKSSSGKLKTIKNNIAKQDTLNKAADTLKTVNTVDVQQPDTTTNISNVNTSQGSNTSNITTANTTTTTSQTTSNSGEKKYYIIAASYTSEEAAQTAVNNLKTLGYASEIVGQNAYGNFRICYNSFSNKDDAQKELERIKGSVQADAWILEK